jgi:hypothetical protein
MAHEISHNEENIEAPTRYSRVTRLLQSFPDSDLSPEQKNAIFLRQDALFGFQTSLESYDQCKEALRDPSIAACIYCGSMITTFVLQDIYPTAAQKEICRSIFLQAATELDEEDDVYGMIQPREAAIMLHLGNSIDTIVEVAWNLKAEGFLTL